MIDKILSNGPLMMAITAVIIIAICIVILSAYQPTMDAIEWTEKVYTVQKGDSLWAISGEYCPDSVDRREWIEEVQALNDIDDGAIHPGQRLIVLAPAK